MSDATSIELPEMLEADRVVFLVIVGLSLVGLLFGATMSEASDFDGAGFAPRPRVRVGVSSCWEFLRCEERAGALLERGIGESQRHRDKSLCRVEIGAHVSTQCFHGRSQGGVARIDRKPAKETQNVPAGKMTRTTRRSNQVAQTRASGRQRVLRKENGEWNSSRYDVR